MQTRLQQWMQHFGFSQGQLSERASVPQPTIHRIVSGETTSPRTETMRKIITALGLTVAQFEQGPELASPEPTSAVELIPIVARYFDAQPQYRAEKLPLSPILLAQLGLQASQVLATTALHGSMAPTILKGETVLIDTTRTELVSGEIFAVLMDDVVMIRRVQLSDEFITLAPDNPDQSTYFEIQLPRQANLQVIGRVFWRGGLIT